MANLPLLNLPIMGRELPRGQRWMDSADLELAHSDPSLDRVAYLEWERYDPSEDLDDEVLWQLEDEPEPDVVVTVNGVALEVWLKTASLEQQDPDMELVALVLAGAAPDAVPFLVDSDILVLLEDEAVELGRIDDGEAPGDEAANRRDAYRAWLLRRLNDDLLWGNSPRGRRSQSRMRWRRRSWERSPNAKAATRAMRAARPEPILVWEGGEV